jgi:hypothetical protein
MRSTTFFMSARLRLRVLGVLLLAAGAARAQPEAVTLAGVVVEAGTREPLPGATVFLSGTQRGTVTDAEGRFTLADVAPGPYEVVVSLLGYRTARQALTLAPGARPVLRFVLPAEEFTLPGIVVEDDGAAWRQNVARFTAAFFGQTPNAERCRLLNPEALTFARDGSVLRGRSRAPLEIENRALGYHVTYFIEDFEDRALEGFIRWRGDVLFREMTPANEREARAWRGRRREAYLGSFRHFLRALTRRTARAEGFRTFFATGPYLDKNGWGEVNADEVNPDSLARPAGAGTFRLEQAPFLHVAYTRAGPHRRYPITLIRTVSRLDVGAKAVWPDRRVQHSVFQLLQPSVGVHELGLLLDPYATTNHCYWSWTDRVSNMLPYEYAPDDEG